MPNLHSRISVFSVHQRTRKPAAQLAAEYDEVTPKGRRAMLFDRLSSSLLTQERGLFDDTRHTVSPRRLRSAIRPVRSTAKPTGSRAVIVRIEEACDDVLRRAAGFSALNGTKTTL